MNNCTLEIERLRTALESIAVAISPTTNAGMEQAKAYALAVETLATPSKPVLEQLNGYLNTLNDQVTSYSNAAAFQKQKADFYADKAGKEDEQIYFWANDGEDHPESLVSAVSVVIRASDLREIIAERDELKAKWEMFSSLDLYKELKTADAINGTLSKENSELRNAIASNAEQTPAWYRRVVHEDWPEWCASDSFSDGHGGGEPYYAVPVPPIGSLVSIREMHDVLRSVESDLAGIWSLYKPESYKRMIERAEYWLSSPLNNSNQLVPLEFLIVADQNQKYLENECIVLAQEVEELKDALINVEHAVPKENPAHAIAYKAIDGQMYAEEDRHERNMEHNFALSKLQTCVYRDNIDDISVMKFAHAMSAKMAACRAKGRGGWDKQDDCTNISLANLLVEQVRKGDPVDIGNYAMMLFTRNASTEVIGGALNALIGPVFEANE